jgi:hypothetical protein
MRPRGIKCRQAEGLDVKFIVVIIVVTMTTIGAVQARSPGQKVTATAAAVACKSWPTLKTLGELMNDPPRFATFWREQKSSGECRAFPVGTAVIVDEDLRAGQKAIMRAHLPEEKGQYWTYPSYFK